jgi:hypothetical protein
MATVMTSIEQRMAALPRAEQAARRALLDRVSDAIVRTPLDQLEPLVEEFAEASEATDTVEPWTLAQARTRNLERLLRDQARVVSETVDATTVRAGMHVSRQRLHQLVSQGRLVAIRLQEGGPYRYPFWQFASGPPVRVIDGLPHLIDAARQVGMEPLVLHFFMVEPNDRLDGRAPYEHIAAGDLERVIDVLSSTGQGPF